jgi:hypothetical protein
MVECTFACHRVSHTVFVNANVLMGNHCHVRFPTAALEGVLEL